MRYFKCQCGWRYVVSQKKVFGPIFEDYDSSCARIMPKVRWAEEYADCAYNFEKTTLEKTT